MRWWMIAVVLTASGCGAASVLELAPARSYGRSESWGSTATTVTHRFAAPVTALAVGRAGACAQLEGDIVECWGVGAIGSERSMNAPRRTRFRAAAPIESIEFIDRPCVWMVGGAVECGNEVGWRTIPRSEREPEPDGDDGTIVYGPVRDWLPATCEVAGAEVSCSIPLPDADVICIVGDAGEPCSEFPPYPPVRVTASAEVLTATMEQQVLCAELIDHRFECWMAPRRRTISDDDDRDSHPRSIGVLVGTEQPTVGYGRACAIHSGDAQLVTCTGFGPLGAESMAGAVGLTSDPWARAFLGVGRAATSDEHELDPDISALCTGRRVAAARRLAWACLDDVDWETAGDNLARSRITETPNQDSCPLDARNRARRAHAPPSGPGSCLTGARNGAFGTLRTDHSLEWPCLQLTTSAP